MEPVKSGVETSEFKMARFVMFAGISLDIVAAILEGMKAAGFDFGFLPAVFAVVGTLTALVASLGYQRSRTMVKVAAMAPKVGEEVAHIRPLVLEARSLLAEIRAERQAALPGVMPPSP